MKSQGKIHWKSNKTISFQWKLFIHFVFDLRQNPFLRKLIQMWLDFLGQFGCFYLSIRAFHACTRFYFDRNTQINLINRSQSFATVKIVLKLAHFSRSSFCLSVKSYLNWLVNLKKIEKKECFPIISEVACFLLVKTRHFPRNKYGWSIQLNTSPQ